MMLASYTDARGGQGAGEGPDGAGPRADLRQEVRPYSVFELNNQCVAHTVLRQWSQAGDACDAAVASALERRAAQAGRLSTQ